MVQDESFSYLWSTGETTTSISASDLDLYTLMVTDANGCSASDSIFVQSVTAISELVQGSIQVFPNPSGKFVQLNFELNQAAKISFELTNLDGKAIQRIGRQKLGSGTHTNSLICKSWHRVIIVYSCRWLINRFNG